MKIICRQTILMKYHSLFLLKIRKVAAKFVVCCSRDWRFRVKLVFLFFSKVPPRTEKDDDDIEA